MKINRTLTLLCLLLLGCAAVHAAERKEWAALADCSYIPHSNNDGDSFHVRCGADEFVVRLYFIDVPETNLIYPERTREQAEHFGASLDATLKAGSKARAFVRDTLRVPFVVLTRKASAQGRARDPRYYAMVQVGGKELDELLVLQGLARVKGVALNIPGGESARAHTERLRLLEDNAREKGRGLWARDAKK